MITDTEFVEKISLKLKYIEITAKRITLAL